MNVLITGCDGSLGSYLEKHFGTFGWDTGDKASVLGMPKCYYTKKAIDAFMIANFAEITKLTCAVLNDGTNHLSWIGTTPEDDEQIMLRNVMAPYWTLNALVALRGRSNPMRIVFVTSQTHKVPQRTTALYCASKAALTQMMRVAARELAPEGWIINAVAPGKIEDTEMSRLTDAQVLELRGWTEERAYGYAQKLVPMQRFTNRAEIANVIESVLSMPSYVNGAVIDATGGV